jgi:membrane fusion protein (multidrug efflux system)
MKKYIILTALCSTLFYVSCESDHKEKHEEQTQFIVTTPIRLDTSITKEYVSQVHSIQHIELRAQERGYLEEIYIDEGDFVKKGQLLFQIMPNLYQAELQTAQAEVEFAEIEYKNTKTLADQQVVAPNELAMAKAKLDKAKAELAMAQVHLDFTQIRAPFDGIIDRFHVRKGSLIEEGDLLTTLSDNSEMWVYFNVSESEYLDYKAKLRKDSIIPVRLQMANGKMFAYDGKVETIEAEFNNETGNIAFRATLPNPNGLLRHGETGNVLVDTPLRNALLIPQAATYEIMEHKFVFVLNEDDVLEARRITIGAEMPHIYMVTDGLKDTDRILYDGLRKVKAGDKIEFIMRDASDIMSHLEMYAE